MRGTDLLSHLIELGKGWLDERRTGWAFVLRHDVGTARLLYVGPDRSGMTLQEVVALLIHVLTGSRSVDEELQLLDFYTSELLLDDTELIGFEFKKHTREGTVAE